jgi:hypothetical protein
MRNAECGMRNADLTKDDRLNHQATKNTKVRQDSYCLKHEAHEEHKDHEGFMVLNHREHGEHRDHREFR